MRRYTLDNPLINFKTELPRFIDLESLQFWTAGHHRASSASVKGLHRLFEVLIRRLPMCWVCFHVMCWLRILVMSKSEYSITLG